MGFAYVVTADYADRVLQLAASVTDENDELMVNEFAQLHYDDDVYVTGTAAQILNARYIPRDYRCEYDCFPVSKSCMTIFNPDLFSISKTCVNPGIRN
jgi:hypothetical protein